MEIEAKVNDAQNKLWDILPRRPILTQLATGFSFTEGPIWCGDYLLFSDIPQNRIVKLKIRDNGPEVTTFRCPSGNSNGLTLDTSGRLIICHHSMRAVTRICIDSSADVLATRYQKKRLNSPNDVVVRSDGSIFFTDPPYGLKDLSVWKEQDFNGVYRISPDGELLLLVDDFERPNGLAFSPDESVLYIDDSAKKHIRAFDVSRSGSLCNGRIFLDMQDTEPGVPDGMKVDVQGNIYCTGPGGIWIVSPEGEYLGRIVLPEIPSNLAWGGADKKTLYITARSSVYCMLMKIPGNTVATV